LIYLDNAATTRSLDSAAAAVVSAMTEGYANPSALYNPALAAEKQIRAASDLIREMTGAPGYEVLFTSGGTESNNLAVFGTLGKASRIRCITTSMEHPSIAQVFDELENRGHEVIRLDCTKGLNYEQLQEELAKGCDLISIMQVNNETGAVQDIARIGRMISALAPKALFHVDGVQAFCRVPLSLKESRVDMYTLSGHKIHGIKGIGALVVRPGLNLTPQILGGGQQKALRPGTQNMPGIMALYTACGYWKDNGEKERARLRQMKLALAEGILSRVPTALINGPAVEEGAPHILSVGFPGLRGETLLHALEEEGVIVGTGSACSSHKKGLSSVLVAQGVAPNTVQGTIRISLGIFNTIEEMEEAADAIGRKAAYLARFKRR